MGISNLDASIIIDDLPTIQKFKKINFSKQKTSEIINSERLFFNTFFQSSRNFENIGFKVIKFKEDIVIVGKSKNILQIEKVLRKIRQEICKNSEDSPTPTQLMFIQIGKSVCVQSNTPTLELNNNCQAISFSIFQNTILPLLKNFCLNIKQEVEVTYKKENIKDFDEKTSNNLPVYRLNLTPLKKGGDFYIIKPIPAPIGTLFESYLQKQLKDNTLVDFTIKVKDKKYFAHKLILYKNGGSLLQTLIKTKANNSIDLSEYPSATIELFIDYIYRGAEQFEKKYKKDTSKLPEILLLYKLAREYLVDLLTQTCANLLNYYSNKESIEQINELALTYNDEYLKNIVKAFKRDL